MSGVPTGWKLVPVEPTKEMVEAGCYDTSFHYLADSEEECINNYRAMLAAAPPPPAPVDIGGEARKKAIREAAEIAADTLNGTVRARILALLATPTEGGK